METVQLYLSGILKAEEAVERLRYNKVNNRDVIDIIKERSHLSFQDAAGAFYHSKTYQALQNTENTLWAESAGYIADRFYEEQEQKELQTN